MIAVQRDGHRFALRIDAEDPVSGVSNTTYITIGWRDTNDLQTHLSQALLDFEIERGAYPVDDEDGYILERHRTGEPF